MPRSRFDHGLAALVAGVLVALSAGDAAAYPGVTGYSGKPYNGESATCTTSCHAKGGNAPTVTITVPSSVAAGSTNAVKVVVAGDKGRTSLNAAFSDGVKTTKGSNADTPRAATEPTEIGAVVPAPIGATGTYTFSFTAPSTGGTITMWVAAMAASGSGLGGDGVANTTRTIAVVGPPSPGDAGAHGVSDAGAPEAGAVIAVDSGGVTAETDEPTSPGVDRTTPFVTNTSETSGCGVSSAGSGGGPGIPFVAVAVLAIAAAWRRRGARADRARPRVPARHEPRANA